jgi:hypothetical protein
MLSKNEVLGSQIRIILTMITKKGKAKDGETINKDRMKDGKIIKVIDKIKMASLVEMGITKIIITEIMEISKEVI